MKRLAFAILLLLTLVSVVDSTGRQAFSQEAPLETDQLAGTDVLLARSASGIEVWKFDGSSWQQLPSGPPWSDAGGWNVPEYYSTIQTGDVDGDGRAELLARSASGIHVWEYEAGGWEQLPDGPSWSDALGWNAPEYYGTIRTGDIDGDSRDELLARSASGIEVWEFDGGGWQQLSDAPWLSDADGYNAPEYYSTIQTGDVLDERRRDQVIIRGQNRVKVWWISININWWQQSGPLWSDAAGYNAPEYYSTIQTAHVFGGKSYDYDELLVRNASYIEVWWDHPDLRWQQLPNGPSWSDAAGWNAPEYYSTIQTGDIDGDGLDELLARSASGIQVWEFNGSAWPQLPAGPPWSDAGGWDAPEYYSTIQTANIEGLPTVYLPTLLKP